VGILLPESALWDSWNQIALITTDLIFGIKGFLAGLAIVNNTISAFILFLYMNDDEFMV